MKKAAAFVKAIDTITHRPLEVIELIIACIYTLGGLWILSPLYHSANSISATLVGTDIGKFFAIWQLVITLPYVVSFFKDSKYRIAIRTKTTFFLFVTALFYGIGLFASVGFESARWISLLGMAAILFVLHVRLRWELT